MPVTSATAVDVQPADASSGLRTAAAATATAAVGATLTDPEELERVKTGEEGSGSLLVASPSPADSQPVDVLPTCAAVGWVTHVASASAPTDGAEPTAADETVAANKG